jgi:hypothetical protein
MSNELAIAAVTLTLRDLLIAEILREAPAPLVLNKDIDVTTLPLAKIGQNGANNQINLFLYQTEPNGAWRNTEHPPLALNLGYLVSVFGEDDNELVSHFLLGTAMRVLYDNAIIPRDKIKLPESGLPMQVERVTVTQRSMPVDDLSKLWSTFSAPYRVSAAYLATVVLIDSHAAAVTPLPVLRRGSEDRGVTSTTTPPPSLTRALPATRFTAARLGDDIFIDGQNLASPNVEVRIHSARLEDPLVLTPLAGRTAERVGAHIPNDANAITDWIAGLVTVSLAIERPELSPWITNEVPLSIAPSITVDPTNASLAGDPEFIELTVTAIPQVRPDQQVMLLFGDTQIAPFAAPVLPPPGDPSELIFHVPPVAGTFLVRLRVDGVDSIPILVDGSGLLQFDNDQKVVIA